SHTTTAIRSAWETSARTRGSLTSATFALPDRSESNVVAIRSPLSKRSHHFSFPSERPDPDCLLEPDCGKPFERSPQITGGVRRSCCHRSRHQPDGNSPCHSGHCTSEPEA